MKVGEEQGESNVVAWFQSGMYAVRLRARRGVDVRFFSHRAVGRV
jgi:hypothetical protein